MSQLRVRPGPPINATVIVPGDKSISHRSIMLGALSDGVCHIDGFLASEDCLATMNIFRQLGVRIDVSPPSADDPRPGALNVTIHGTRGVLTAPPQPLDCGNSGTTMRLMSGILAAQPFRSEMFGDASLSRRPMRRVAEPLSRMGAKLSGQGEKMCPPLVIEGGPLQPIHYTLPVASAQVKSAVLLAGLFCEGETRVTEPVASRDHTERMLAHFGIELRREGNDLILQGGQRPKARAFSVPGDISSAAFWLVAAAARPGSELWVRGVGLNPTRTGILKVLARMGADVHEEIETAGSGEPAGSIRIRGARLRATTIGGKEIPTLIDELPVLAVAAALAEGTTVIKDAHELRVKETDRISVVAHHLRAMGVTVREREDGLEIDGPAVLRAPAEPLPTHGDHRIGMAFAIAGLNAIGETVIDHAECINTSYPGFEKELARFQGPVLPLSDGVPARGVVIAMDGPAASGKSSVARELGRRLGFAAVNSGALYRAVALAVVRAGVDPTDADAVAALLTTLRLECGLEAGQGTVRLNGEDPAPFLHEPAVNAAVSPVASIPAVREFLIPLQRAYAEQANVILEGRDIGSVIFPETPYKFFLDASPEVRAARRGAQGQQDAIAQRDAQDRSRAVAPLKQAEGAVVIDSSALTLEETVEAVVAELRRQGLVK